jgi:hypothetical protein
VRRAIGHLGIGYPVALDDDYCEAAQMPAPETRCYRG